MNKSTTAKFFFFFLLSKGFEFWYKLNLQFFQSIYNGPLFIQNQSKSAFSTEAKPAATAFENASKFLSIMRSFQTFFIFSKRSRLLVIGYDSGYKGSLQIIGRTSGLHTKANTALVIPLIDLIKILRLFLLLYQFSSLIFFLSECSAQC